MAEESALLRENFFVDFVDQALAPLQVARELLYELLEARATLRTRRFLVCFRYREANGEVMAHKQRHRLDQDGLVAVQLVELARELVEPTGDRGFAGVSTIGRKKRSQCNGDDSRF